MCFLLSCTNKRVRMDGKLHIFNTMVEARPWEDTKWTSLGRFLEGAYCSKRISLELFALYSPVRLSLLSFEFESVCWDI